MFSVLELATIGICQIMPHGRLDVDVVHADGLYYVSLMLLSLLSSILSIRFAAEATDRFKMIDCPHSTRNGER